ncbi:RNA-directed DNA polymerase, eukaryota, reverse transcriptase zinc-binding domain protein [Tanacetum coccineum]
MTRMGFESKWCRWVEACLKSSLVSILVNGSSLEEFGVEKGIVRGVRVGSNQVMVSHLQYADDIIFFREWNSENVKALMSILRCFEEVLGLQVNFKNSKLYGLGVSDEELGSMASGMGCDIGEFSFTYLGLPIGATRGILDFGRIDYRRLRNRFPRLLHLDRSKEGSVMDKGTWVNNEWVWDWIGVETLVGYMEVAFNVEGGFKVKTLMSLIEEKIIRMEVGGQDTLWNKLVPKKVNIFVWRARKDRLPVRVKLDKRGIDLDSILCDSCNDSVETCTHCLVTCDLAMSVWTKLFNWWKVRNCNAFTIDEIFSHSGNAIVPTFLSVIWQAVIWTSRYFIWKVRNDRVFGNKVSSANKIVQDIQLKSYE